MVNYGNSKIYKICDNTNGNIYIGSTVKSLAHRLSQHKSDYKRYIDGYYHKVKSFEIIKNGDYEIVLLEECPPSNYEVNGEAPENSGNFPGSQNITNKEQLHARERHYIDTLVCVNKHRPGLYNELGEKEYKKEYYETNKETIKGKMSERITCPHCQSEFWRSQTKRHQRTKKHINNIQEK
jgi:hypothetical protein